MIELPSYHNGFAPRDGAPKHPSLWQGLVGCWPMLGPTGATLPNVSGYGAALDGVITGAPAWGTSERGWHWDISWPTNYALVPDAVDWGMAGDFTASIWFRPGTLGNTDYHILSKRKVAADNEGINLYIEHSTGDADENKLIWLTDLGASNKNVKSAGSVDDGAWHCAVIQRSGTTLAMWLDGVAQTSDTNAGNDADISNTDSLRLGINQSAANYWLGQLGPAAWWSRALAPQEARLLYDDPHAVVRMEGQ